MRTILLGAFLLLASSAFTSAAHAQGTDRDRIVGTEQVRAYRFEGDRLHLESPPQPHPNIGGRVVRIIVSWDREK